MIEATAVDNPIDDPAEIEDVRNRSPRCSTG